jgi:hypothetical protein
LACDILETIWLTVRFYPILLFVKPNKILVIRITACVLLTLSMGISLLQETSSYTSGKAFIKAHSPVSENVTLIGADDIEDLDEDGSMDILTPANFVIALFPAAFLSTESVAVCAVEKVFPFSETYLRHHQLLI